MPRKCGFTRFCIRQTGYNYLVQRVIRILRITTGALALLVCTFIVIVWVRSYFKGDQWRLMSEHDIPVQARWTITTLQIGKGGFGFRRTALTAPPGALDAYPGIIRDAPWTHWRGPPEYPRFIGPREGIRKLGFHFASDPGWMPDGSTSDSTVLIVPFWSLFLVSLVFCIMPTVRLTRWFRSRLAATRSARNLCPHCNYDLRATPDRCPECGHSSPRVQLPATI